MVNVLLCRTTSNGVCTHRIRNPANSNPIVVSSTAHSLPLRGILLSLQVASDLGGHQVAGVTRFGDVGIGNVGIGNVGIGDVGIGDGIEIRKPHQPRQQ